MLPKIRLKKRRCIIYKKGIPFYDAARLIGVSHLFFGTASAEIVDKGNYWEVSGIETKRDEDQIFWVLERLKLAKKEEKIFNNFKELYKTLHEYFAGQKVRRRIKRETLGFKYDAVTQKGTRGVDPLSKYENLAPRSGKEFKDEIPEIAAATVGRAFAALVISRAGRQKDEMHILPVFSTHFVLSGFLNYKRVYQHSAGGYVASVLAAISILLDLTSKKIPVVDFAYTRRVSTQFPVFSESGYLGFEKLCNLWWKAVEENNEERLEILRQIKSFLDATSRPDVDSQNQDLARYLAQFVVMLDVDSLCMIEKIKARIIASGKNIYPALNLFKSKSNLEEVCKMMNLEIKIPEGLVDSVARILSMDEKGWINKLTRLENASNIEQFVTELERMISRGVYVAQTKQERAINDVYRIKQEDLENLLKLQDPRTFRAFKAIFLLSVLSKIKL